LVYDELAYYKKEDLYEEVSGKMGSAFSLGLFLSAIFGGLVALVIGTGCTPSYNYKGEELKVVAHYPINEVVEISEGWHCLR